MSTLDSQQQTLRGSSPDFLQTNAGDDVAPAVKSKPRVNQEQVDQWEELRDNTLLEWGHNPDVLADEEEGIRAPSREIITLAYRIAMWMSKNGMPAPTRIVPDGDGGIVFKRCQGDTLETMELSEDGNLEYILYKNGRVDSCARIPLPDSEQ